MCFFLSSVLNHAPCTVYTSGPFASTIVHAATPRKKLQIKLAISPSHRIMIPGEHVQVLIPLRQAPWRAATAKPIFKAHV